MCDKCMKHGAGGKWYLNARKYSEEVAEKYNLREFLLEQYKNFEQISVRPMFGVSPAGMDRVFRMPIIGRLIKRSAERMLHSTRPPSNPFTPEATSARWSRWRTGWRYCGSARPSPSSRRTACAAT